jgi:hypothetical protein
MVRRDRPEDHNVCPLGLQYLRLRPNARTHGARPRQHDVSTLGCRLTEEDT